jgi:tetratricopeptide (TPR) repeat protein
MHKPFSRSRVLAFLIPQRSWRSFLIAVLAAMIALDAQAGTTEQKNLFEAVRLSDQGKFAEAMQLLNSIVHSDPSAVSDAGRGMAWNALGTLRMLMGENQASRECLENAIRLLSNIPASSRSYASALANLGSLEMSSHAYDEAAKLLNKAHDVDARAEDHAGLQQIALYRTTLSIAQKNTRGARRSIAEAFHEASLAKDVDYRDQAAMWSLAGSVAMRSKHYAQAAAYYEQSIQLGKEKCGTSCYDVGIEHAFLADSSLALGDKRRANLEIHEALALTEETVGRDAPIYLSVQLIYIRVLRSTGAKEEADRQERQAKQHLEVLRQRQCIGCTISAFASRK